MIWKIRIYSFLSLLHSSILNFPLSLLAFSEKKNPNYVLHNQIHAKAAMTHVGPKAQKSCSKNESFYYLGGTLKL